MVSPKKKKKEEMGMWVYGIRRSRMKWVCEEEEEEMGFNFHSKGVCTHGLSK
jgi:hypothetical protein